MERLTSKYWRNLDPWEMCGQDNYCKRGCHEQGGCTKGCIVPRIYARLAAYEDTGLEPEEVISATDMAKIACALHELNAYKDLGPIDHLRGLIQAEQAGLLVVLPCKVGDVIRFVSEDKQGYTRYEAISFNVDQGETFIVASCKPGSARLFSVNDIGKTVFLTREEAEAALAGKGSKNE